MLESQRAVDINYDSIILNVLISIFFKKVLDTLLNVSVLSKEEIWRQEFKNLGETKTVTYLLKQGSFIWREAQDIAMLEKLQHILKKLNIQDII